MKVKKLKFLILVILTIALAGSNVTTGSAMVVNDELPKFNDSNIIEYDQDYSINDRLGHAFSNQLSENLEKNFSDFVPDCILIKLKKCSNISTLHSVPTAVHSIISTDSAFSSVSNIEPLFSDLSLSCKSDLKNLFGLHLWARIEFEERDIDIVQELEKYRNHPLVQYAEPNYIYSSDSFQSNTQLETISRRGDLPDDPGVYRQWALHNTGQTCGTIDADIDAAEAWTIETGDPEVIVAIIDTGVYYGHDDLSEHIWLNKDEISENGIDDDGNGYIDDIRGWDFISDDNDPNDEQYQGTHCSGVVSAVTNNGIGIAGVCWNCTIMPLRGLNKYAFGTSSNISEAIIYACANGADVVSCGWRSYYSSQVIADAIDYSISQDVIVIAAAGDDRNGGNPGPELSYPAAYDTVIGVAATDHDDRKAAFSRYGNWIDIAAPGDNIKSTVPYEIEEKGYELYSGTSIACAHVAGLAALIRSKNLTLSNDIIKTIILSSADELNSPWYVGRGRINCHKALENITPIAAFFNKISTDGEVSGEIEIRGTATAEEFTYYTVEYGAGKNPEKWVEIINSTTPIKDNTLTYLNTSSLNDGMYLLRLKVRESQEIVNDTIPMLVNNKYNIFYVDDDNTEGYWDGSIEYPFQKIHDAIDSAGDADDIFVYSGIYYDYFSITRQIDVFGEDKNTTIIDGNEIGCVINILADKITFTGFTIQNSAREHYECGINIFSDYSNISGNIITKCRIGIKMYSSFYTTIIENSVTGDEEYMFIGIWGSQSNNCQISHNIVRSTLIGVYFPDNKNCCIIQNSILKNKYGLLMRSYGMVQIGGHCIDGNLIMNNDDNGLYMYNMKEIQITNNSFYSDGISIDGSELSYWNSHRIENNTANERPIYYYKNINTPHVVPYDAGQVILANCSKMILQNLNISDVDIGITLGYSSNNQIYDICFTNFSINGIYIRESDINVIDNCRITSEYGGDGNCVGHDGIFVFLSTHNEIINCTSNGHFGYGFRIFLSQYITLKNCFAKDNWDAGIHLFGTLFSTISNCTLTSNRNFGIQVVDSSDDNKFFHNYLSDNGENAVDYCINTWDNGYSSGGNYWDDYTGNDSDGDGIGDIPYNITGRINQDRYPLGFFDEEPPNIEITYPKKNHLYFGKRKIPFFTTFIIGPIDVCAKAFDNGELDRIELYINGVFKGTASYDNCHRWNWTWDNKVFLLRQFTIKIIAYDKGNNTATDEITAWKFL